MVCFFDFDLKNVKWYLIVLKMLIEIIKWMWVVVEEWRKSDGNNRM